MKSAKAPGASGTGVRSAGGAGVSGAAAAALVGFFLLSGGLVVGCEKLRG